MTPILHLTMRSIGNRRATVALTLLTTDGLNNLTVPSLVNPAVIIALSMIGGNIFGLISEALAGLLARKA